MEKVKSFFRIFPYFSACTADSISRREKSMHRKEKLAIPKEMCYDSHRGDPMYFDEIKLGMAIETAPVLIEKEKMMAFARDYDNIPLHTDEEYAKTTIFGNLIAPGVMSFMSVWAKYLEVDFFGKELLAGKSTKIEWLKPVYAGDTLIGKATVTNLTKRSPKNGIVEVSVDVYNQNGQLVLQDVTEAVVKCRREA